MSTDPTAAGCTDPCIACMTGESHDPAPTPTETDEQRTDRITLNRGQLAALLAHHADVIAARWDAVAPGAGAWEVAAAYSLRGHAAELTADEETAAVRELLDSALTFNTEQQAETDEQRADREETERDHAKGDHTHCGLTCETEVPTEHLRNFVIAKGYPGTAGALDELLRRARAERPLSPYYEHPACGFHWHGRDGMDIPIRDGQPVCPRCELRRMADEAQPAEPRDTCRPVEVDGETIRVHGSREMTEQERGYLADVVRAAKRKFEAEHTPEPS